MFERELWKAKISEGWRRAPIVWLAGVRRAGKTTLAQSLERVAYFNCDLPSVGRDLLDPETFYRSIRKGQTVIFDEVHQLEDPSRVLKLGADTRPDLRILATGSSTLAATTKFRDTLTGRKRNVELTPVLWEELDNFGVTPDVRLLQGGLPPALLAASLDTEFYAEWIDSYFARDVQELFRIEKRSGFLALLKAILRQSGGQANVSALATLSGLTRPTVLTYLDVLETTHAIRVLRPYSGGNANELVRQPKIYGFDTGFVAYERGWDSLRAEDRGILWEHVVLETLVSMQPRAINYWRDKQQHEVDFVIPAARNDVHAIECKWSPKAFVSKNLEVFRERHPKGKNYVVVPHGTRVRELAFGSLQVEEVPLVLLRETFAHA